MKSVLELELSGNGPRAASISVLHESTCLDDKCPNERQDHFVNLCRHCSSLQSSFLSFFFYVLPPPKACDFLVKGIYGTSSCSPPCSHMWLLQVLLHILLYMKLSSGSLWVYDYVSLVVLLFWG